MWIWPDQQVWVGTCLCCAYWLITGKKLEFAEPVAEIRKMDEVGQKLFGDIGMQLAAISEDGPQWLIDSLRRKYGVDHWDERFISLTEEKKKFH